MKNEISLKGIAFILGGSFIIGLIILAFGVTGITDKGNTLTTTGSHKTRVMSDNAVFNISVSRIINENSLPSGYVGIEQDTEKVKDFLVDFGVEDSEITIQPVLTEEIWNYNENSTNQPRRFTLRQNIKIESSDIEKITNLSKNTSKLAETGVFFTNHFPEYYISNLAELRVSLLGTALIDAKARASEIAGGAGNKVGKLSNASSGVVQVLSPNSLDVADYGTYNTQTPEKDVQVTVRATFKIK